MKISWRLTLLSTAVVSAIVISMFLAFYRVSREIFISSQRRHLFSMAKAYVERGFFPQKRFFLAVNEKVVRDPYGIGGRIPLKDGIYEVDGEYYIVASARIGGRRVTIASYATPIVKGFEEVSRRVLRFVVLGIALSFAASFLIANISLSPLRSILKKLKGISAEKLEERMEIRGSGDEIDELAKEINSMLDRIEKAYRAQERFVHDVSHELRNPLASMKGFLGILKRWGCRSEDIFEESLKELEGSVEEMEGIIENLLALSRMRRVEMEEVDLRKIAEETVEELSKKFPGRKIIVEGEAVVRAGREEMKMIIRNLLDNALKYTDGRVWVRLKEGCLEVADEGEGIPEGEKVFEMFYRSDRSRDRRKEGHGIGLSLVKELAERMRMKVELETQAGRGSTFRVIWGDRC